MDYAQSLEWLFQARRLGVKLGLDNARRLLAHFGLPGSECRIIHVAGTNGKGSVCALADAILRSGGARCGLFTSPHLVCFRERIRVDGKMIARDETARWLGLVREATAGWDPSPTFFEIVLALAMLHFREASCTHVVLETGMGGRLDATNAVPSHVAVITRIGMDHQAWLGDTLEAIAGEKAGIIQPGNPVVLSPQEEEAAAVLRLAAAGRNARVFEITAPYPDSIPALPGLHQQWNAAVAAMAVRLAGAAATPDILRRAFESVHWPGRFQRVDDRLVLDGAHNPDAARALAEAWRGECGTRRATVVLASAADKDVEAFVRAIAPVAARFIATRSCSERSLPPETLREIIQAAIPESPCLSAPTLPEAFEVARANPDPTLLTGSLFLIGDACRHLGLLEGDPFPNEAMHR